MQAYRIVLILLFFMIIPAALAYFIYDSFKDNKYGIYKYVFIGAAALSVIIGIIIIAVTKEKEKPEVPVPKDPSELPRGPYANWPVADEYESYSPEADALGYYKDDRGNYIEPRNNYQDDLRRKIQLENDEQGDAMYASGMPPSRYFATRPR